MVFWHSSQSQAVSPCNIVSCRRLRILVPQILCFSSLLQQLNHLLCFICHRIETWTRRKDEEDSRPEDKYGRKKSINLVFRGFTQLLLYVLSDISHEGWSGRAEIGVCLLRLSLPCCYREILSCKREINSRFPLYFLLRLAILSFTAQTAEPKKAEKDFANKLKCFGHKQWENENGNSRCGRKDQKKNHGESLLALQVKQQTRIPFFLSRPIRNENWF